MNVQVGHLQQLGDIGALPEEVNASRDPQRSCELL